MPAPKKTKHEEEKEDWLTTYADAITLLMAFFVMLLTFAEYDIPAYQEAVKAIKENVGNREEASPTEVLQQEVTTIVNQMQADQVVTVTVDDKGIVIELASNAFYKPGSAEVREAAIPVLNQIAQTLSSPRYDSYAIEIEGHTDDDPISTEQFPSNWELSGDRATRIVRLFSDQELDPRRMNAKAFGETRPKVPNRDAQGNAIPENQAINRRINIRVFPMSLKQREQMGQKLTIENVEEGSGANLAPVIPEDDPAPAPETGGGDQDQTQ
jgi:chemotaxis protein MotB